MDTKAMGGVGGVVDATWGTTEGVGTAWGTLKVDEAHDEGAANGQAVGPPGVVVGLLAIVMEAVPEAVVGPLVAARPGGGEGVVRPPRVVIKLPAVVGPSGSGGTGRPPSGSSRTASTVVEWEPWGAQGASSDAGMGATLQELSCRKMSKSLVRWGEATKGKSVSSKTICRETMILLVERSRYR
jgi:hypothetical protein